MAHGLEIYRVRTARKDYRCDGCHRAIKPGDRHTRAIAKNDVSNWKFWELRLCPACDPKRYADGATVLADGAGAE